MLDTLDAEKNATSGLDRPDNPILLQSYLSISWRESSTLHVHHPSLPFTGFLHPTLPKLKFISNNKMLIWTYFSPCFFQGGSVKAHWRLIWASEPSWHMAGNHTLDHFCCSNACAIADVEQLLPWMRLAAFTVDTDKRYLWCIGTKIRICLPLIF